jgi:3-isopropylmalate dehydratase small subunit
MSESVSKVPDSRLAPVLVFEFAVIVFDRDMTNDHRNEDFTEEVAKTSRRMIGVIVAQIGWSVMSSRESAEIAIPSIRASRVRVLRGFP